MTNSPDIKKDILSSAVGLTTDYFSRKMMTTGSNMPVKKIIGSLLQFALAKIISKNSSTIISKGEKTIRRR